MIACMQIFLHHSAGLVKVPFENGVTVVDGGSSLQKLWQVECKNLGRVLWSLKYLHKHPSFSRDEYRAASTVKKPFVHNERSF